MVGVERGKINELAPMHPHSLYDILDVEASKCFRMHARKKLKLSERRKINGS